MKKTVVINAVGLSGKLLGENTPWLNRLGERGGVARIRPVMPAVTCSVQATYLTGAWPSEHGIVGNGWYFRDECEVKFWRQSNKLVQRPKIWEVAKGMERGFTCANMFWWYNMYSTADYSVTPRPMYPADGRKLPDIYTQPGDLRGKLQAELGQFPLFNFWGPATSIRATQWIADASVRVDEMYDPTLTLIYLPHLDYCLQKFGPDMGKIAGDVRELDEVCGKLIEHYQGRGARVIVLSEYGIGAVSRPVHLNRVLREHGMITVREEMGRELLDAGASAAFAVADHQVAHVYVNDRARVGEVKGLLEKVPGVGRVLDEEGKREFHLDHERSGELIVLAERDAWFTYYYWMEDEKAPDFARTVDIHRKPGYDPAELFIDRKLKMAKVKIATRLLKKKLGFRYLMDVIGLDAAVVKGSHGVGNEGAILISSESGLAEKEEIEAREVFEIMMKHLRD